MKVFVPIIAVSALLASTVSGWSEVVSGDLQVRIVIGEACKVNPGGSAELHFGSRGDVTGAATTANTTKDGKGSIQVQCSKGTKFSIALGDGKNPDPNGTIVRNMKNGTGETIPYELYSDSTNKTLWGSGSKSGSPLASEATGGLDSFQVFGLIPKQPKNPKTGTYEDTVAVTVTF
ncbi:spore coat U domain-containing protein [Phyllobacterium sp. NPDC097923]|uniref:Csu type fimbrial protein n=1 Tax=Phyllobacterium sp. NPDC097923 TaxID=3364404 RepID=UPI00383A21A1